MPKRRKVPTLRRWSLRSLGCFVETIALELISEARVKRNDQIVVSIVQQTSDRLRKLLPSDIPRKLYDDTAREVLNALTRVIYKAKPSTEEMATIVIRLMEIVFTPQLRSIDFHSLSAEMIHGGCYKNLHNLSGLESLVLTMDAELVTEDFYRYLKKSISAMKNLKILSIHRNWTDVMMPVIGDHCLALHTIDLFGSKSVTDLCIPHLLNCVNLKDLGLYGTSVTAEGMARIIAGLPKLQSIGCWQQLEPTIVCLQKNYYAFSPFDFRWMSIFRTSSENIRVLVNMFPKIEAITLTPTQGISVLGTLTQLNNLSNLKLISCTLSGDYFKQLLEVRGVNISFLKLHMVKGIDYQTFVDIGQYCPELQSLELLMCTLINDNSPQPHPVRLTVKPFMHLTDLIWDIEGAIKPLKFILYEAINIRKIDLMESTDCTHSLIENVLSKNPMSKLEIFSAGHSSDMDVNSVKLLIAECPNLKSISLRCTKFREDELKALYEHIHSNNFDLQIAIY